METEKKKPETKDKKKSISVILFVMGCAVMLAGIIAGVIRIVTAPGMRDAEYLVEVGTWAREDEPSVIWTFTEIGKGTLTTNNHTNDYDFLWRIDGDTLKIETEWLYVLNDEYAYELDQGAKTLILTSGETEIKFVKLVEETTE